MILLWNELKKIFDQKKRILITIVFFLTLTIGLIIHLRNAYSINEAGQTITGYQALKKDKEYKQMLNGELSDSLVKECVKLYQNILRNPNNFDEQGNLDIVSSADTLAFLKYSDLGNLLTRVYSPLNTTNPTNILNIPIEDIQSSHIFSNRTDTISFLLSSKNVSIAVDNMNIDSSIPYQYAKGWNVVLGDLQYIILLCFIIIAILCSATISMEDKTKTRDVLFISTIGGKKIVKLKILASLLSCTLLYLLFTISYALSMFCFYGFDGAFLPLQLTNEYWLSLYNMNFFEAFIFVIILGYIGVLAILGITLMLSSLIKKDFLIISLSLLIILLPQIIDSSNIIFLQYAPSALCNTAQNLISFEFITIGSLIISKCTTQLFLALIMAISCSLISYTCAIRRR